MPELTTQNRSRPKFLLILNAKWLGQKKKAKKKPIIKPLIKPKNIS